jgi:serine/threonine-protein kinase
VAKLVELTPGQVFAGKYRVERLVKAGGMGAVYEVRHTQNQKRWALKVMHADVGRDPSAKQRFAREAQIDGVIGSTHVVSVIDAGVDDATLTPYLVMEFLEGEELGEWLARAGRFSPEHVVALLSQLARALDRAHAKGIIHRDLKPDNLFVTRNDEEGEKLKILDFGIAKVLDAAATTASTQAGGTPLYMAPEQTRRGRDIGPWTDIWALGLIAYTLLVGRTYWNAESIGELFGEILDVGPRERASARAALLGVALPPAFDDWFACCTHAEPSARFPTAGEAVASLARALAVLPQQGLQAVSIARPAGSETQPFTAVGPVFPVATTSAPFVGATVPAPLPSPAREPKKRWPLIVAGVAGVAVLVGVAIAAFSGRATPESASTPAASKSEVAGATKPTASASASAKPDLRSQLEQLNPFVAVGSLSANRTEVTRGQFAMFLATLSPRERRAGMPLRDFDGAEPGDVRARRPVTWVTQRRASLYCQAIGARLPSNDEWTSLAGGRGAFPWGTAWPPPDASALAIGHGERAHAVEVGTSKADVTSEGVADLFGNVGEWTSTTKDGLATVRGGHVDQPAADARSMFEVGVQMAASEGSAAEDHADEIADPLVGFRCVRSS